MQRCSTCRYLVDDVCSKKLVNWAVMACPMAHAEAWHCTLYERKETVVTEKRCANCEHLCEGECLKLVWDGMTLTKRSETPFGPIFKPTPDFHCPLFKKTEVPWWVFSRNEGETWLLARSETGFLFDDYVEAKDRKSLDRLRDLLNRLEEVCCVGKDECRKGDCGD